MIMIIIIKMYNQYIYENEKNIILILFPLLIIFLIISINFGDASFSVLFVSNPIQTNKYLILYQQEFIYNSFTQTQDAV